MLATLCLALAGLGLLVGLPSGGFTGGAVLASTALAVLAASGFATVTLVGSRPVPGLDELTTTGLGFTAGGLLLLPLAGATVGLGFPVAAGSVGLVLALGTGPAGIAGAVLLGAAVLLAAKRPDGSG